MDYFTCWRCFDILIISLNSRNWRIVNLWVFLCFPGASMVKKIHHISFYALLMTVYTVFFSVQSFFNFDRPGPENEHLLIHLCSSKHPEKQVSLAKETPSHSSSHSFRLNKRFHQENILPCDAISSAAPKPYLIRRTLGHYRDSFLPSVTPCDRLLRGPPSMA